VSEQANHMTPDEFRTHGAELIELIASYYETLSERPVLSRAKPGDVFDALPDAAPESGEPFDTMLADVERIVMPAITNWQSPGFFGYFPASSTFPAILGEMLSAGLGVQGMLWQTSPACTELETKMLDWMGRAIGLPECFLSEGKPVEGMVLSESHSTPGGGTVSVEATPTLGGGVIQGTASEAVLVTMVAARQRMFDNMCVPESERAALNAKLVAYTSTQAHSSILKAAMIAGITRENVRLIGTDETLAMDPAALRAQMDRDLADGLYSFFICATIGTTSTGAVDPVNEIARVNGGRMWLHVDAAYAGAAMVCEEHRWAMQGIEAADSFNFNPHKWLLINFDCSCLWVQDRGALVSALSITPEYLRNAQSDANTVIDYRDWQIPLGRRFRALKMWFVMRHYGLGGLRAHIREHVRLAQKIEALIAADERFESVSPRSFSLVCFRLKEGDDATRALMDALNETGEIFLTHTVIPFNGEDVYAIRFAVGAVSVSEADIDNAWALVSQHAS